MASTSTTEIITSPQEESQSSKSQSTLATSLALSQPDRTSALRLVSDSVAQQRQTAARSLIFHPLTLSVTVALIAIVGRIRYNGSILLSEILGSAGDLAFLATTAAGCVMVVLASVQAATGGYLAEAERVGTWRWLMDGDDHSEKLLQVTGEEDIHKYGKRNKKLEKSKMGEDNKKEPDILVTKYNDQIIGALILQRQNQPFPKTAPQPRPSKSKSTPTGVIRAWTVHTRYRKHGLGTALLEDAVSLCRENGLLGPVFAEKHANSHRVLPGMFNGAFEQREKWGKSVLERILETEQSK